MLNRIKKITAPKQNAKIGIKTAEIGFRLFGFLTILAGAVKIEGVMADVIFHHIGYRFLDFMHPRIAVFINPAAGCANDVVVLFAQVGLFELGDVFAELVLDHEAAVEQQFHGIVKRGPADPVVLVFHVDIQLLDIEMAVAAVYLIEYRESFRGLPVAFPFYIFGENVSYRILDGRAVHNFMNLLFFPFF
jgi:hypothetical protein